ncbi:MAG: SPOR domain-containing protein [Flavobacteriaceae bacterium]|jgi:flagellar basal body P-ring protein FlgI|nr:SPOR domain-containing protein [Flavobacteriaceae bacterium]|tara:strand:+ start:1522 stop:1911 length:390 start_codon:yes stop_codon:yes gene_type:complete
MRTIKRTTLFFLLLSGGIASQVFGQDTLVQINQDSKIEQLVAIKKELDSERYNAQYFAIQLYYGNYTAAQNIVRGFSEKFEEIETSLVFETPNYKVRVGRFKDINKANILLEEIKKIYPGAFLLEPNNL